MGAGPAGALAARSSLATEPEPSSSTPLTLARSHAGAGSPRKPCGSSRPRPPAIPFPCAGWTGAASIPAPAIRSRSLAQPVGIASRRALDAWLLRRAVEGGALHVAERVTAVDAAGRVCTSAGRDETFDVVIGADGAGSLVRRTLLSPTPPPRLMMAAGWFARGDSEMVVRFAPELEGYLWLFPRPGHVGVGICAPLARVPTRRMIDRLESEVARAFPALVDGEAPRYAHTIPSPSADPRSLLEVAGDRWGLIGDAAAFADPITGEGIYYGLRSAEVMAETLRTDGSPRRYPERALESFGRELLKAAALHERFYAPGFARRMVRFAARSGAIRNVLADLVLGEQGYGGSSAACCAPDRDSPWNMPYLR